MELQFALDARKRGRAEPLLAKIALDLAEAIAETRNLLRTETG